MSSERRRADDESGWGRRWEDEKQVEALRSRPMDRELTQHKRLMIVDLTRSIFRQLFVPFIRPLMPPVTGSVPSIAADAAAAGGTVMGLDSSMMPCDLTVMSETQFRELLELEERDEEHGAHPELMPSRHRQVRNANSHVGLDCLAATL